MPREEVDDVEEVVEEVDDDVDETESDDDTEDTDADDGDLDEELDALDEEFDESSIDPEDDLEDDINAYLEGDRDDEFDEEFQEENDDEPEEEGEVDLDKDIEKEGEEEILPDLLDAAEEAEESEEEEISGEEITDDMITAAMATEGSWQKWYDEAESAGVDINDNFAALLGRNRLDPSFFIKRSIHSISDLVNLTKELEEKVDPETIVVPREDDEEGWETFKKDVLRIPTKAEEYPEEVFRHSFLDGDEFEEERGEFLNTFVENGLTAEQAEAVVDIMNTEREAFMQSKEEEARQYRENQQELMEGYFGEDYQDVLKDVKGFLNKYGQDFKKEFRGQNALNSASLAKLIYDAMNDIATPNKLSYASAARSLKGLSDDRLLDLEMKIAENKYYDAKNANSSNPKVRKQHQKLQRMFAGVAREITRRGIED